MSAEKIAAVLAAHDEIKGTREAFTCICGYGLGNWTGDVGGRFRLHKAAMLEPVIREREAAALEDAADDTADDDLGYPTVELWLRARAAGIREGEQ